MPDQEKSRRFRLIRKVSTEQPPAPPPPPPQAEPEEDDADRGTPEMDRGVRQGCNGCVRVTGLVFVIMVASIIGTCFINWNYK